MTFRLYYDQPYLKEFTAVVQSVKQDDGGWLARLDRSAFYPTSGGQPFDTGTLGGANVTDVFVDGDGEVWHRIDSPLTEGASVTGAIDWARRFDHMQQHAGEHMIAGCIWRLFGGVTKGLHLGREFSTIDVEMPDGSTHLTEDMIQSVEDNVNAAIQNDVPIRCWFPDGEELSRLPLRKPPTVKEHVRIVAIGDDEMVACGGTHPSSAGQIGLVKIIDTRPSHTKVRVAFVCGMRAVRDYREKFTASTKAAAIMSIKPSSLPESAARLNERVAELEHEISRLRQEAALGKIPSFRSGALSVGGYSIVKAVFDDLDMDGARRLVTELIAGDNTVALIALRDGEACRVIFARGAGVDLDMGKLLKEAARLSGGRGGGKSDYAQGASKDASILDLALEIISQNE